MVSLEGRLKKIKENYVDCGDYCGYARRVRKDHRTGIDLQAVAEEIYAYRKEVGVKELRIDGKVIVEAVV